MGTPLATILDHPPLSWVGDSGNPDCLALLTHSSPAWFGAEAWAADPLLTLPSPDPALSWVRPYMSISCHLGAQC